MLTDLVDRVTPGLEANPSYSDFDDDEDDDEKMKRLIKEKTTYTLKVLCIWDCAGIWIKISEIFSIIVFDAFTEVFITLCILVNVVFMALDHYLIEYDGMWVTFLLLNNLLSLFISGLLSWSTC